ncbi:MAG: UvrB/UvrC motif-containing protein [Eubacteriales bacterium]
MLCERCAKNPATVYLTKIINGKKTEVHLCEQCASETEKVYLDKQLSFQNLLSGLLDMTENHPQKVENKSDNVSCPVCHMTYKTFRKTGKFGCANCYETFGLYLPPILKRIHGNYVHTGKMPKNAKKQIVVKRKIEDLRYKLKKAVQKEEFEEAARLRDEIRELEKKGGQS